MFRFSSPLTLRLEPGQTLAFPHGPRARMTVRAGAVHLTRQGDAEDHFLADGQAIDLRGSRAVVIEALRPSHPVLLSFDMPARSQLYEVLRRCAPGQKVHRDAGVPVVC